MRRSLPPGPPESGDRAELLVRRAEVLPRLRKRSESIPRAVGALVGTVLVSFGVFGVAWGIQQRDQPYQLQAGVVLGVFTLVVVWWPLSAWRDGRRSRRLYLEWLLAPERWPGAPADVPLGAKTVADAATLDELDLIRRRDTVALQTATAQNGPGVRLLFGGFILGVGLIGMLGLFLPGGWPGAVFGAPYVVLAVVSVGGIFRLGGVTSIARRHVIVAARRREAELAAGLNVAEQE